MTVDINLHGMTELGFLILADRYFLKDAHAAENLMVGDIVIAILNNESTDMKQKRELGVITAMTDKANPVEVTLYPSGKVVNLSTRHVDRPLETSPKQLQQRVAKGIASVEEPHARAYWQGEFEWLMDNWRFVPGGRILTAAGTDQALTAFNCFVINCPHDSRGGIFESLQTMAELMSRGGGVGINVSSLRPKNARVEGVNGRSSGAVSWGALFSYVTGLIEQSGSRRGALMLMLNDWHPDILHFIASKRNAGQITNANISVGISDSFMQAVKDDADWVLRFPDTKFYLYDTEWDGDLAAWEAKGYPVLIYKTMKAREIWNAIVESAWASAEPGLFFIERCNVMSNSASYTQGKIICCNPCAEEPLPGWGVCNLGAINLAQFYDPDTRDVAWDELSRAAAIGARFLDNVISWTPYHFDDNREQQEGERRIGLGIMGLAELLIKIKVRYGSPEGVEATRKIFQHIKRAAYLSSTETAVEKGSFPFFETEGFLSSGFMQTMDADVIEAIRERGIRNVTLMTVAPTGSTGTMVNTSTGIEPFFSWEWWRKGRLGLHKEHAKIVRDYLEEQGIQIRNDEPLPELPSYFVNAMELSPDDHVKTQAAAQQEVDAAISKTVNVPNEYTIEQVSDLYFMMYDLGCKGGTIYRDGSRDEQVLHLTEESAKKNDVKEVGTETERNQFAADALKFLKAEERLPTVEEIMAYPVELLQKAFDMWQINGRIPSLEEAQDEAAAAYWKSRAIPRSELMSSEEQAAFDRGYEVAKARVAKQKSGEYTPSDKPWAIPNDPNEISRALEEIAAHKGWSEADDKDTLDEVLDDLAKRLKEIEGNNPIDQAWVSEKVNARINARANSVNDSNKGEKRATLEQFTRPVELVGKTYKGKTPFGSVSITINEDGHEQPCEVFINIGKSGSDLQAQAESMGRMMSIALQPVPSETRRALLKRLVEQNRGIGGARASGFGQHRVASFPDAVAKVMEDSYLNASLHVQTYHIEGDRFTNAEVNVNIVTPETTVYPVETATTASIAGADMCPECHQMTFVRTEGCKKCLLCGETEC